MANIPTVGLRNVGSYQISGHPFMTGAALVAGTVHKFSFPYITKKITVTMSGTINADNHVRIQFVSGSNASVYNSFHFAFLDGHEDSQEFDVKCKEIYVVTDSGATLTDAAVFIYASLTTIPTSSMYHLTGSGLTEDTILG